MTDGSHGVPGGDPAGEEVPKLPRGRGLRLSRPQMVRIAATLLLLVFLVMMQRPCADAVSTFVTGFGDQGSAAAGMPRPGNVDLPTGSSGSAGSAGAGAGAGSATSDPATSGAYERLRPGMTDDEIKAAIERARAKAQGSSDGPAPGSSDGSAQGSSIRSPRGSSDGPAQGSSVRSGDDRQIR